MIRAAVLLLPMLLLSIAGYGETVSIRATAPTQYEDGSPLPLSEIQKCDLSVESGHTATLKPAAQLDYRYNTTHQAALTCTAINGETSRPAIAIASWADCNEFVPAPTNVRLAQPNRSVPAISVTWTPAAGVTRYEIRHGAVTVGTSGASSYTYTLPAGRCLNTGEVIQVRSVSESGALSAYSSSPAMPRQICP